MMDYTFAADVLAKFLCFGIVIYGGLKIAQYLCDKDGEA